MIKIIGKYFSGRRAAFIFGEGVLIFCAVALAGEVFLGGQTNPLFTLASNWWRILIVTTVVQMSMYFSDLYEPWGGERRVELPTQLIQALGGTSILLGIIYFLWPDAMIGKWIFFLGCMFLVFFFASWRLLYSFVLHKRLFSEKSLILGDGDLARDLLREINRREDMGYNIRCVVARENGRNEGKQLEGVPLKYGFEFLCDIAEAEDVSKIIVALDEKRGVMPCNALLDCKVRGIEVIDGISFFERITGKLLVEKTRPGWFVFSDGFRKSSATRLVKRTADLAMSVTMSILLSPVFIVVASAIKLDSRGPALFKQERVGENGKIYTIFKFRSMVENAEANCGPVWAEEDDARITRVGRFIRKLRIDELPQLWNVIKGDMSFVGPRPERPFFVEQLTKKVPYYQERFSVKPGITGWAQVRYGYGATEQDALEKLKYDLYYTKNISIMMDLAVLLLTVKIVLLGRGAR